MQHQTEQETVRRSIQEWQGGKFLCSAWAKVLSLFYLLEMELWNKTSAEQITSPSLRKWDFEYEYNPDFDLGMGEWISNGDNDELLQQGEQTTSEREQ